MNMPERGKKRDFPWRIFIGVFSIVLSLGFIFFVAGGQTEAVRKTQVQDKNAKSQGADDGWGDEGWGETEAPVVHISRDKRQLIGVRITEARLMPLDKTIRAEGVVTYDETRLATINTKFEGWIEKLYVDYTGEYVRKGQPLATLYSPELYATELEYLNVLKWARQEKTASVSGADPINSMLAGDAQSMTEAARQRLKLYDIPDSEIKKIEKTGKPVRTLTIFSPVSGYVVEKYAVSGMKAAPGAPLFNVADLSRVWILADIFEDDLPYVRQGQEASISLTAFPGKVYHSRIDFVYPALSNQTRTMKVRFSIPNPGGKLKPEMYSDVLIKESLGRRLVIPQSAVIDTGTRQVVYVDKGNGDFEPREITTGASTDTEVEVLTGLKPGERVASAATFLIDSEARLEGVVK